MSSRMPALKGELLNFEYWRWESYIYIYVEHKGPQPEMRKAQSLVILSKLLDRNPLERTDPSLAMNHLPLWIKIAEEDAPALGNPRSPIQDEQLHSLVLPLPYARTEGCTLCFKQLNTVFAKCNRAVCRLKLWEFQHAFFLFFLPISKHCITLEKKSCSRFCKNFESHVVKIYFILIIWVSR